MDEKNVTSWENFRKTGHIEAYLLYKAEEKTDKEDKEEIWRKSEQEALS